MLENALEVPCILLVVVAGRCVQLPPSLRRSAFSGLSGSSLLLRVRRCAKLDLSMSALVMPEGVRHRSPELGALRVLWTILSLTWITGNTGMRELIVTLAATAAGDFAAFARLSA